MQDIDFVTITNLPEKILLELHASSSSRTVGCFTLTREAALDLYFQLERVVENESVSS